MLSAVKNGYIEAACQLLGAGADPNITDDFMGIALNWAVCNKRPQEFIDKLKAAGAGENVTKG